MGGGGVAFEAGGADCGVTSSASCNVKLHKVKELFKDYIVFIQLSCTSKERLTPFLNRNLTGSQSTVSLPYLVC